MEIIEKNPFVSQQEMADKLSLPRSTVATIISALTQKKYLLGRAYVLNEAAGIYCIGAMNVDRKYRLKEDLVLQTSNPATSSVSVGGVARNIAENLGRLQLDVSLLSMGGHDQDFHLLKRETEPYVNMQHVMQKNGFSTGAYNAVLDAMGEMQLAIADMQIYDEMSVEWISEYRHLLIEARLFIIDLNLPVETVAYLLSLAEQFTIDVFIIPVSGPKMNRLPQNLESVTWLIVNQDESETYFDVKVETEQDFEQIVERWLDIGVQHVVVTRGSKASRYGNQAGDRLNAQSPTVDPVVDVTGAGDAYASGIIYGYLQDLKPIEAIELGMTNAYHTIQSKETVRHDLTAEKLMEQKNTLFKKETL